jgi:predicted cobalt transporter CbtA
MPLVGRRGPGLVRGVARTAAIAGTASAVSGRVARRQQRKFADQDAEYYQQVTDPQQQPQAAAPAPTAAEPEYIEELQKLATLRDQGVISADDFEAKKKQLLGI